MHKKHFTTPINQETTRAARWVENGQASCDRESSGARRTKECVALLRRRHATQHQTFAAERCARTKPSGRNWLYLINKGNVSKARVEDAMDRLPEAHIVPHRTPRQEYLEEGMEIKQIDTIQAMLAKGCEWSFIEEITQLNELSFQELLRNHIK